MDTLSDIVGVVERSAACNSAEVIGWEDGTPLIPMYNWTNFFAGHMKKIIGTTSYRHFHFSHETKGIVECRMSWNSQAQKHTILKKKSTWQPNKSTLPDVVPPEGLDGKRQWYLYDKIRQFCIVPESKDVTCPLPCCPRPSSSAPPSPSVVPSLLLAEDDDNEEESTQPPVSKRPRQSFICCTEWSGK